LPQHRLQTGPAWVSSVKLMRAIQEYSSFPLASGFVAGKKDLARLPPADYVDAVAVEVVPVLIDTSSVYLTRAQSAIRLYTSIFRYNQRPAANIDISA
jgi:hypothetical protein